MCLYLQGPISSPPAAERRGEDCTYQDGSKFPLPLVTKTLYPPLCQVQNKGTRPSGDAQRKGGDSRGSSEIIQGENVSRSHAQSR